MPHSTQLSSESASPQMGSTHSTQGAAVPAVGFSHTWYLSKIFVKFVLLDGTELETKAEPRLCSAMATSTS